MAETTREIRLASRPEGEPRPDDFELAEVPTPEPGDGEVLVRNSYLSVDPYMRGRMRDVKSYIPPFQVGQVLDGGAVGQVVGLQLRRARRGRLGREPARLARALHGPAAMSCARSTRRWRRSRRPSACSGCPA